MLTMAHRQYENGYIVISQNYFIFSIEACHDAKLALGFYPDDIFEDTYEVVLGTESNKRIEIRNGLDGTVVAHYEADAILDCSTYK